MQKYEHFSIRVPHSIFITLEAELAAAELELFADSLPVLVAAEMVMVLPVEPAVQVVQDGAADLLSAE